MLQALANFGASSSYNYSYTTSSSSLHLGAAFWIGYAIFIVIAYLVGGFIMSRVFRKAGRSMGAAFVPVYNNWVLLEMGGQSGANALWIFLPFVGSVVYLVFYVMAMLELGRRFGKSVTFSVVALILFSLIGFIILAFDDSTYQADRPVAQGYAPPQPGYPAVPGYPQQPYQAAPGYPQQPTGDPNQQPPQPPVPPTGQVSG